MNLELAVNPITLRRTADVRETCAGATVQGPGVAVVRSTCSSGHTWA
eukprot:CAMPEP_0204340350 /NCGR_PEP_ID=MMETSP0469-20131031/22511_1 /ASSEMBLY_ACC=CAM_ASM_000384 /TAXON_ID=2969 /ORGANISM="Oxyrrhis marina" /LENGTH=46 /DNA_ID= /DNA_START= /DNA_END= /DNA_ORIENTATION=